MAMPATTGWAGRTARRPPALSYTTPIAKAGLERIAQLYRIEDRIRGEPPATRQFVRWTEAAPLVDAFGV